VRSRNVIAIFYVAASLASASSWAKDEGFRYHPSTGQCLNHKGEVGFNKAYFGECGDIRAIKLFRKRKIKKAQLAYANLRGIQINGLNFSEKDLRGADLTGANLQGTDLELAKLDGAKLEKARFNERTILPFSATEAAARGMLNINFINDRPIDDGLIDDILLREDSSYLTDHLAEIRRPDENYHARIRYVFDRAQNLTYEQVISFMDAIFAQRSDINQLSHELSLLEQGSEEYQEALEALTEQKRWSDFANILLLEAIQNKIDLTRLSPAQALILASRAIPFTERNLAETIFDKLRIAHPLNSVARMIAFIQGANASGAFNQAGQAAAILLRERGDISIEHILEMADEFFSTSSEGLNIFFANALNLFERVEAYELLELIRRAPKNPTQYISVALNKIATIDISQAMELLSPSITEANDRIIVRFFELNRMIELNDFVKLFNLAGAQKDDLIHAHFFKISNLTPSAILTLLEMTSESKRDRLAKSYIQNLTERISSSEFISIIKKTNEVKNELLSLYLNKISNLSASSVKALAELAVNEGKDLVIRNYLTSFSPALKTSELIELSLATYQTRNETLLNLNLVSDLNTANILLLVEVASHATKDQLLSAYLQNFVQTLSAAELINLSRGAHQQGSSIIMSNITKVQPLNLATTLSLAQALSAQDKDSVLKYYLESQTSITLDDLLQLAGAAHTMGKRFKTEYLGKISNLNYDNTLKLAATLSTTDIDLVIAYYLQQSSSLTSLQLEGLARVSFARTRDFISSNLSKIANFKVADTLRLKGFFTYGALDTFLLQAIELITDLTVENVHQLADMAYQSKDRVLRRGLERVQ
jgi:hypothetical protein